MESCQTIKRLKDKKKKKKKKKKKRKIVPKCETINWCVIQCFMIILNILSVKAQCFVVMWLGI
jgi:hypothetical protein